MACRRKGGRRMRLSPFAPAPNTPIPDRAILGTARTRRGVLAYLEGYGLLEITWQDLRRLNAVAAPVESQSSPHEQPYKEEEDADRGPETSEEVAERRAVCH